jgi:RNA-directed DNA polymerase
VQSLSALKSLKQVKTLHDLAHLLGYQPSGLSYLLYKLPANSKYTTFTIPKKGGGARQIDAPVPRIKRLQAELAKILYKCLVEVEAQPGRKNTLSHAFRQAHSILTNAKAHRKRRYVLNLDLQDFFPTFNFGRVRGYFLKNNDFLLSEKAATLIAQIACYEGALPQGSPCSPIISELLTHFLDIRLATLAKKHRCTYTRYADDLTFSTNQKEFPVALAVETEAGWTLGSSLVQKIESANFTINPTKTRMQLRARRQTVTGLVVNEKINVRAPYYKNARAMADVLFNTGTYIVDGTPETSLGPLEGILNHIYHVREGVIDAAIEREPDPERKKKKRIERAKAKRETPSAIRALYHRLLFYKHFIAPLQPVLLGEGPTDSVYLKAAIRALPAFYSKLTEVKEGKQVQRLHFFRYSKQAKDILQLGGGTGDFKYLLTAHKKFAAQYKHAPMAHPVILLIDNDSGSSGVFSLMKSLFHVTASIKTDLPFYKLASNLYVVKTPPVEPDGSSYIEQFFDPALLATTIEGKTFNPDKEHEAPGEYGKVWFAEKVIQPNQASIVFTNFTPILERIVAVLEDHAANLMAATR